MMGISRRPEPKLFYTQVDLSGRIPPDHFLRQVDKLIDFTFVRVRVEHLYGRRGNESIDPAVVLKLMFLLFYEQVASERSLMEQMAWRLDWMWFCGFDLDSAIPDHSILSKARRRWGAKVFESFFAQVLDQCMAAGLIDGSRVHIDSSLIEANADRQRLQPALHLAGRQLYEQLEQAQGAAAPAAAPATPPAPVTSGTPICPTDPEARLTRKYGESVLGYKDNRVVDDRCGIITATLTTDAAASDGAQLPALLDQHQFNMHQAVEEAAADKAYGTAENYRTLQERQIQPCIPHPHVPQRPGKFGPGDFRYDAQRDGFVCPAGQFLGFWSREEARQRTRYQARSGLCAGCPLKRRCTDGQVRRLSRYDLQPYIDWADGCGSPLWRRRMMRRRKIRAEGSFADAANNHGFKRARWRGLWKVRIQNLMVAAVQNIRKLVRAVRRGLDRAGQTVSARLLAALRAFQTSRLALTWPSARIEAEL